MKCAKSSTATLSSQAISDTSEAAASLGRAGKEKRQHPLFFLHDLQTDRNFYFGLNLFSVLEVVPFCFPFLSLSLSYTAVSSVIQLVHRSWTLADCCAFSTRGPLRISATCPPLDTHNDGTVPSTQRRTATQYRSQRRTQAEKKI
jgi:hypothetical protein